MGLSEARGRIWWWLVALMGVGGKGELWLSSAEEEVEQWLLWSKV